MGGFWIKRWSDSHMILDWSQSKCERPDPFFCPTISDIVKTKVQNNSPPCNSTATAWRVWSTRRRKKERCLDYYQKW